MMGSFVSMKVLAAVELDICLLQMGCFLVVFINELSPDDAPHFTAIRSITVALSIFF